MTPQQVLERLADDLDGVWVFGVRHHSSACAAALQVLLDERQPDAVLVELPEELGEWLPWVGHPETVAPIALGAVLRGEVSFWPFADFSPELVAIRWAVLRGRPVFAIDLPIARRGEVDSGGAASGLVERLAVNAGVGDADSLWERMVEGPAAGSSPEAIRRAALAYGWAIRSDCDPTGRSGDLLRERWMRRRIGEIEGNKAVVVGAFHAAGLKHPDADPHERDDRAFKRAAKVELVSSFVPYGFEQLDSRSGYPAGIRDPEWHQRLFETGSGEAAAAAALVEVCRWMRTEGHAAGTPDAMEALRVSVGLARMRKLGGPGRREVIEGAEIAIGRGETRGLTRALDRVLIGRRRGSVPDDAPRSGLGPHVEALLTALKLPRPTAPKGVDLRLDPLRSELDRRRHVAMQRLCACNVDYCSPQDGEEETLGAAWSARFSSSTLATLEAASSFGVTLEQAATGAVRAKIRRLVDANRLSASIRIDVLAIAAECGLHDLVHEGLAGLGRDVAAEAGLPDVVRAYALVERIARGHVPGCPRDPDRVPKQDPGGIPNLVVADDLLDGIRTELFAAATRALGGLAGSDDLEDVRAMVALVRLGDRGSRVAWELRRIAADGSPQMQGGAQGARILLGDLGAGELGEAVGAWIDGWGESEARLTLIGRLEGVLVAIGPQFEGDPRLLLPMSLRIDRLEPDAFLERLPALRTGFDVLAPSARDRLLRAVGELVHGDRALGAASASAVDADAAGARAAKAVGLVIPPRRAVTAEVSDAALSDRLLERFRLILDREIERMTPEDSVVQRVMHGLHGEGRGEGAGGGVGGERTQPFVSTRTWLDALDELFEGDIRADLVAAKASQGDPAALGALDPATVEPSMGLLLQLLNVGGKPSQKDLAHRRALVQRCIDELTKTLQAKVRPALAGMLVPRPTRRRTDRLNLRRTVLANLARVRFDGDRPTLVPERLWYSSRARRSADWRVILLVDVSGSMDGNVVHAALMAAILAGLPALSVHFLAFAEDVADLTARVDDPLGLLLAAEVGGGTDLLAALRYARELVVSPSRTILTVISDFDDTTDVPSLVAEVRGLVASGVRAVGLAALDEHARPHCNVAVAEQIVAAGMPVSALTPTQLARFIAEQIT